MLLIIRTAHRRYAVPREDLTGVQLIAGPSELQRMDTQGGQCVGVDLGPLLDPMDRSALTRRHALVVALGQGSVALLVDAVEDALEQPVVRALPELFRGRLRQPWATGVVLLGEELVVRLDLRAVARTVSMGKVRFGGA